ncbi:MAG: multidrug MFS transporter [Gammaproteobacteria bacterium RIFCSPHIGHO2_12_FULL_37_34]|nr:MAG: multidrug MFS transporter [Gammaproteobacteria bacterium RIFCSPHIGHO2_12_FULL_37_34]
MASELYKSISPIDRWLITIVVMSATLMQVIDSTIVNVALPHMQGELSASPSEITWTLTSYLIASAIFMPLTGYFSDRLGRKNYLIFSIAGFTFVSALCGASTSLNEIIIFRLLQGIMGASLVPLSQAILADIFPPEERGKAMAIWGIGIMVGPILGPTLGGYLTDVASWRWTFYINVPIGIFTLLLANIIPDTPKHPRYMDWIGFGLLTLAIGGTQYVLDRGNQNDWFSSTSICFITYLAITGLLGFIFHSTQKNLHSVFSLDIFKDENFVLASILMLFFITAMFGVLVILPLMMEGLFNYPAFTTGLIIAPRGISGMISMFIVGRFILRVDPRWFIITGCVISAIGMWICTFYSLNISPSWLIWPMVLQGLGIGMIIVPLSTVAFSTLPYPLRTDAAGLFSLVRTMGGSIGISIAITLFVRRTQVFWNELGGGVEPYHLAAYQYLAPLHLLPTQPLGNALLATELHQQAAMLSYINVFVVMMWCFLMMIPFALFLKRGKKMATPIEIK